MQFQVKSGAMTYSGQVNGMKDVFDAVGKLREVLLPGPCGCCNSLNTFPASKKIKDNVFYEHVCGDCTATRRIVLLENGHMFISLKDKNKQVLPNGGWSVYKPSNGQAAGDFGTDGYQDPPSRQTGAVPVKSYANDNDIPF